jgi:hypothetical protein
MAKKSPANTKKFTKDKVLGAAGILIIVIIGGYFAMYRPLMIRRDKDRFIKAQASIEDLFTQIEAKVGKPDQVKRDQSCSYANREFERGPLACAVSIYALYGERTIEEASGILLDSSLVVGTPLLQFGEQVTPQFTLAPQKPVEQTINQDYKHIAGLSCKVDYSYPFVSGLYDVFTSAPANSIKLSLVCGGPANAEHFPVKN